MAVPCKKQQEARRGAAGQELQGRGEAVRWENSHTPQHLPPTGTPQIPGCQRSRGAPCPQGRSEPSARHHGGPKPAPSGALTGSLQSLLCPPPHRPTLHPVLSTGPSSGQPLGICFCIITIIYIFHDRFIAMVRPVRSLFCSYQGQGQRRCLTLEEPPADRKEPEGKSWSAGRRQPRPPALCPQSGAPQNPWVSKVPGGGAPCPQGRSEPSAGHHGGPGALALLTQVTEPLGSSPKGEDRQELTQAGQMTTIPGHWGAKKPSSRVF